jgi:hypothetical protein
MTQSNFETPTETFNRTGATFIPKCEYCGEPLTSNEFETGEPGDYSGGFYSAHGSCQNSTKFGRYSVGFSAGGGANLQRRYNQLLRAEREAAHLASCNAGRAFNVVDTHAETTLSAWTSESYGDDAKRS